MTADRRETSVDLVVTWPVVTSPLMFHGATIPAYLADTFGTNDVGAIHGREF